MPSAVQEPRDSVRFADRVAPNSTGDGSHVETYEVQEGATVEQVDVRIYRGAELDLRVRPFIRRGDDGSRREIDLIQFQGKQYIDGDGDHFEFTVSQAAERGDLVGVEVENHDDTYGYDYAVDMALDRAGGIARFGGVVDRIRGWF
ncbi:MULTISPECIES: hypothetical protein [Salinibaculum]|uniref:hypothetical protein n=1 Tax=Salinibaculum TaxID=2732368 RepID=UPI0030D21245